MTNQLVLLGSMVLSPLLFLLRGQMRYWGAMVLHLAAIVASSGIALSVFNGQTWALDTGIYLLGVPIRLELDALGAFYVMVINLTMLTGSWYSGGYLKPYEATKTALELSLHRFVYFWLHLAMLIVVMVPQGTPFLFAWELMTLAAFVLVAFEWEKPESVHAAVNYLVQMHVGFIFILIGFLLIQQQGGTFSFSGIAHTKMPVQAFLMLFVGFAFKAGFMPLHTWLPHAHPAAPSHVSGVMSGVIIKMGIYGILRSLIYLPKEHWLSLGAVVLIVSIISGVMGVIYAIMQHDIKKLLAYHSIENIGIIGIGIGLGMIGYALGHPVLAALAFAGGILHILNHSLFKSLLFYSAGSVYQQTHTRYVERLGGLIKKMPYSAFLFLLGALAICGLPPFNGFISEFLIYYGSFTHIGAGDMNEALILLGVILSLALIGGLAIFCFTKVFSIVFLGSSRSDSTDHAHEVTLGMLLPQFLIGVVILAIGLFPGFFVHYVEKVSQLYLPDTSLPVTYLNTLSYIGTASGIFILLFVVLALLRNLQQRRVEVAFGPTWGCGYTGADPARHQYTATSYADNFVQLAEPILGVETHYTPFAESEIFPKTHHFDRHQHDPLEEILVDKPGMALLHYLRMSAVFQSGKLQHYLWYGLVFLVVVGIMSLLNLL